VRQPREDQVERRALADDLLEVVRGLDLLAQRDVLFLEAIPQGADLVEVREQFGVAALAIEGAGEDLTDDPQAVDVEGRPRPGPREVARRDGALDLSGYRERQRHDRAHADARRVLPLGLRVRWKVARQVRVDEFAARLERFEVPRKDRGHHRGRARFNPLALGPDARVDEGREIRRELEKRRAVRVEPLHDHAQRERHLLVEPRRLKSHETAGKIADHVLEGRTLLGHSPILNPVGVTVTIFRDCGLQPGWLRQEAAVITGQFRHRDSNCRPKTVGGTATRDMSA
jgi:hypothetical protein